jgi:hypothetical protein
VRSVQEKNFLPYCKSVLEMMQELMLITDIRSIELRCRATECAGIIAVEYFQPYLSYFMEKVYQGLLDPGLEDLR